MPTKRIKQKTQKLLETIGSLDGTLKIWCLETNSFLQTLIAESISFEIIFSYPILGVHLLSNKKVLSYGTEYTFKIWDL